MNCCLKLLALLCAVSTAALASGIYGNQSDIRWKAAATDHFQFIYPAEYTDHAAQVSAYAEAVYDSVVSRYRKDLPGRVNVTLSNSLYSNGNAIPTENTVNLWLTDWDFKLRSTHGWTADVITHEFSHLVSIENGSKLPPSIFGVQASYTDYYNERTTSDFATLIPFTLQPLWLAEGTAQYESARMGFDSWDTHRDMILRVAALNDGLLSLEYMNDFGDNSLDAELGPYNQGFSLVRYISKHYGEDAVPKIWTELSKLHRATLNGAIKKVLGISEKELYEAWKAEITTEYKAQKDSLGTLVEGTKITTDAFWQDFPVVAGKNVYGVSNFGGPWFDGGIFKIPLDEDSTEALKKDSANAALKDSSEAGGVEIGDALIEQEDSTLDITKYSKSGFKTKKPWFDKGIDIFEDSLRGPILAYVNYQNRDKNGHAHFDIGVVDTNKNSLSLTYLADAVFPSIDAKGETLYFARRENSSTRFVLSKVPFPKDFDNYTAEDPVDIFVPDAKYRYFNIFNPKASPDGKQILFGFFDDVHRGLAVVGSDGSGFRILTDTTTQVDERDGIWASDTKIIFASNKNNIFNLFERNLDGSDERALTNVVGGAFTPALAEDTLYFTEYDEDGFSLYKIGYNKNHEKQFRDSLVITPRDCIIQIADTVWSVCDTVTDSQPTEKDSLGTTPDAVIASKDSLVASKDSTVASKDSAASDSLPQCVSTPTVTLRDSTITLQDTSILKVEIKDSAAITLHGTLPPKIQKNIELADREFANAEKDYRPIPMTPLFVPMIVFNENAPDLTVFGEGQLKAKVGLAVLLFDPLKKNAVEMGLLLEVGEGFDYINGDGLNPEQEKEFYISWENHSTPFDLGLTYSYANYTSKDTVRYEDVRAHDGDSLGISNYAIPMQSISGRIGYSIFKTIDTLQAAVGYDWADFNLYEDDFSWTYQKRLSALIALGLYGDLDEENSSGISGQGDGVFLYYQYSNSDLYRPGTFAESFYITESGSVKPKYRNFNINEVGINLYGSVQSPLTGARLAAGGKLSGIIKWNTNAKEDTLDSYYYSPVLLEGYPYLRSNEDFTLAGTKTAMAEVHYLFPIYDDWRKSLWIFSTRDFYFDVFAQTGAAWNTKWFDADKLKDHDFWDRSVGFSLRMSNKLFYSIPLDISLTLARGLSRIGEAEDLTGGRKLTPIDLPLLPNSVAPTRIKFAIGMGFVNSWQ